MKRFRHILKAAALLGLLGVQSLQAQTRLIVGTVTGSKDGQNLSNVSVSVVGTNINVFSDNEGRYAVNAPASAKKLQFTLNGFQQATLDIPTGSDKLDVKMESDEVGLNTVTITALGISRQQRALGYSSQNVSGAEIQGSGEQNVVQAISSKVAGAFVQGSGGTPGASAKIILRGNATFTGNNQPLMVVDGVPIDNSTSQSTAGDYPFNSNLVGVNNSNRGIDINPDDVESISVLKGPAAAALYGVRGANGAIIITTKRGKATRGGRNFSASLSSSVEWSKVNKLPEIQTGYGQGVNGGGRFIDSAGTRKAFAGTIPPGWSIVDGGTATQSAPDSWGPKIANGINNAENFFQTGITYNNNLSVSAGGERTNVRASIGNMNQTGIVPNTKFNRTTVRVNTDTRLTNKITFGSSLNFINSGGTRSQNGSNLSGVMLSLLRTPANFDLSGGKGSDPWKNPDGSNYTYFAPYDNPYWSVYENPFTDDVNRLLGNTYITYRPLDWLDVTYRVGIDQWTDSRKQIFAVGSNQPDNAPGGEISENVLRYKEFYSDLLITARRQLTDDIGLNVLLGNNLNNRFSSDQYLRGRDLAVPDFYNINNAANLYASSSSGRVKTAAIFLNAELSYKSMLYLNVTGRNEWASTFGTAKSSFFYPSVNTSFVFTELTGTNKILSYGKVRLAYATAGINPPAYATRTYFVQPSFTDGFTAGINFPYLGQNGFGQSGGLGNSALEPERNTGMEIGFDLRFLKGRASLDLTLYNQQSSNIILGMPLAPSSGFGRVTQNAGKMENRGIEMVLGGTPIKSDKFTWEVNVNWASNRNKVLQLAPGVDEINIEAAFASNGSYAIVGEPYGVLYGSRWRRNDAGQLLIGSNGLPLVDAQRGNIGIPYPKWYGGLRNTFTFKGVTLTALLDVRRGGQIWNGTWGRLTRLGITDETAERDRLYLIEGVKASDGTPNDRKVSAYDYFRTYRGDAGSYASENAIQDGSWTRLRELGLSYNLKLKSTKLIQSLDLGIVGKNLLLFTEYKGIDPETSLTGAGSNIGGFDYFNNPGLKSWIASIKFNF
jgi:TonB-linked SusC/RagA family outer membrane protein